MNSIEDRLPARIYKITAVDDSKVNLAIIVKAIGNETGYDILTFDSGSKFLSAIETPEAELPDLILLDVVMPDPDGFAVARQLKAMDHTKDIPIIFITSLDDTESRVKAFENGGVDYVGKPFDREELIAHIDAHLQLKRVSEELEFKTGRLHDLYRELEKTKAELEWLNDQKNQYLGIVNRDEDLTFL
jgi:DNA-binding response OmpR family regulator